MTLPLADAYAEHRPFLWSLCYRMLGSAADAEDVVQDTFVRAIERPPQRADLPIRPWLVQVALNRSRDVLRHRRSRSYIGPWLPSPIDTGGEAAPPAHEPAIDGVRSLEGRYDLLESVSFAFLLALEALTPTQRGVLLLRDVFDYSVKETADALDMTEANVKTTLHRARRTMESYDRTRRVPTPALQEQARATLNAFLRCLQQNDVQGVEALLADEVRTMTDGGGEFQAALRPILGREKVARFYLAVADTSPDLEVVTPMLNGMPAVLVTVPHASGRAAPRFAMTLDLDRDGRIARLYVVSATAKLTALR
jgi:RNA polymerase sigma-70 factor (ECF subfamily)